MGLVFHSGVSLMLDLLWWECLLFHKIKVEFLGNLLLTREYIVSESFWGLLLRKFGESSCYENKWETLLVMKVQLVRYSSRTKFCISSLFWRIREHENW